MILIQLTETYNFTKNESYYNSPDKKVFLFFEEQSGNYLNRVIFDNLDEADLSYLGFQNEITYEGLEQIYGFQCYDGYKLDFAVLAYIEPDSVLINCFHYIFNFHTNSEFDNIWLAPLNPENIRLNETGVVNFLLFDCIEGDCVNGYGELRWTDGFIYKGTFSEGFPVDGIVYDCKYGRNTKYTEFTDATTSEWDYPTIFDPETYMDPLLSLLYDAVDEQRNIRSAREEVDYYQYRMQNEPEMFVSARQNMITYAERGIEYSKECKRITKKAYNLLVDTDNGYCLDALFKLSEISNTLQDIEDVFWILRHIAIENGEMNQVQINIVENFGYLFNNVTFGEVERILENCGYFD